MGKLYSLRLSLLMNSKTEMLKLTYFLSLCRIYILFNCIFAVNMRQMIVKIPVLLMSLYCLFLAVLPCHCSEPGTNTHAHITRISQQEGASHSQDSKVCTPFCICAGVHNPNFFTNTNPVLLTIQLVETYCSPYADSVCHYHRIDIWRPPKSNILL